MNRFFTTIVLVSLLLAAPALSRRSSSIGLGKLSLRQSPAKVLNIMGPPTAKAEVAQDPATKVSFEKWSYPEQGVEIDIAMEDDRPSYLYRVSAVAPCRFKGYKGVNVGSFEAEVKALVLQAKSETEVEATVSDKMYRFQWTEAAQVLELMVKNGKVRKILLYSVKTAEE